LRITAADLLAGSYLVWVSDNEGETHPFGLSANEVRA
jgi:hypothetical protein